MIRLRPFNPATGLPFTPEQIKEIAQANRRSLKLTRLYLASNRRCHYCGVTVMLRRKNRKTQKLTNATADHIIPRAAGGTDALSNLVLCCRRCNEAKANMTAEEYMAHLKQNRQEESLRNIERTPQ